MPTNILYVQTVGNLQTSYTPDQFGDNQKPEKLLAITIQPLVNYSSALIILNVPNPYASGLSTIAPPGGQFGFDITNAYFDAPLPIATFTYSVNVPPNSAARTPVTLVTKITPLPNQGPPVVQAWWRGVRGNVFLDSPASLTAVLI